MTLKLDFEDSQADPDSAVNAYGKQIDSGMTIDIRTVPQHNHAE